MFAAKLFLVVVLLCTLNTAEGCSFVRMSDHYLFCTADFVTLALIRGVSGQYYGGELTYNLQRIIHFRTTEAFQNSPDNKGARFSVGSITTCEPHLGNVYDVILVTGYVDPNGKIRTTIANWFSKFLDLPKKTRNELFDGSYHEACKVIG